MTDTQGRPTPTAVATYLVRTGWRRTGERNAGTVWTRPRDGGVSHLFQPEDPASPDHALRIGEMLAALARVEDRSQLAVLADLCVADHVAGKAARRTDWMEPEYGLRRPELALVLDLATGRVDRQTFVCELQQLDWSSGQADELADLLCGMVAAGCAPTAEQVEGPRR